MDITPEAYEGPACPAGSRKGMTLRQRAREMKSSRLESSAKIKSSKQSEALNQSRTAIEYVQTENPQGASERHEATRTCRDSQRSDNAGF